MAAEETDFCSCPTCGRCIRSPKGVLAAAQAEVAAEDFRAAVEKAKERLREHRSRGLMKRLFPWTINITRRP